MRIATILLLAALTPLVCWAFLRREVVVSDLNRKTAECTALKDLNGSLEQEADDLDRKAKTLAVELRRVEKDRDDWREAAMRSAPDAERPKPDTVIGPDEARRIVLGADAAAAIAEIDAALVDRYVDGDFRYTRRYIARESANQVTRHYGSKWHVRWEVAGEPTEWTVVLAPRKR